MGRCVFEGFRLDFYTVWEVLKQKKALSGQMLFLKLF